MLIFRASATCGEATRVKIWSQYSAFWAKIHIFWRPQLVAIFGDKNVDINNKKTKRRRRLEVSPFLTDEPSFFRGFNELESRYISKTILLLINKYFFYLKGIQNVRKDSCNAVAKHSSPYPTRVFPHFPACHMVACCTRFFLFPGGLFQHASFKRLVFTPKNVRTRFKILVRLSS